MANRIYLTQQSDLNNYLSKSGGTLTGGITLQSGNLAMNSNRITGLGTPSSIADAANKSYVDSAVSGKANTSALSNYLAKSGGTMTGNIAMGSHKITGLITPSSSTDAANKSYVDSTVNSSKTSLVLTCYSGGNSSSPSSINVIMDAVNLNGLKLYLFHIEPFTNNIWSNFPAGNTVYQVIASSLPSIGSGSARVYSTVDRTINSSTRAVEQEIRIGLTQINDTNKTLSLNFWQLSVKSNMIMIPSKYVPLMITS